MGNEKAREGGETERERERGQRAESRDSEREREKERERGLTKRGERKEETAMPMVIAGLMPPPATLPASPNPLS
jgi:hypothetical protein